MGNSLTQEIWVKGMCFWVKPDCVEAVICFIFTA